jgi:hypothetical protein
MQFIIKEENLRRLYLELAAYDVHPKHDATTKPGDAAVTVDLNTA